LQDVLLHRRLHLVRDLRLPYCVTRVKTNNALHICHSSVGELTAPGKTKFLENHNIRSMNVIPPYTFPGFHHNAMQTAEQRFNLGLKQTSDNVVKRHETAGVSTWDCLPLSVQGVSGSEATAHNSEQHSNRSQRQVSSGTPTARRGSSMFLCGVRTFLLVHTAKFPDDSNFHRSKNLKPQRPYFIIRCKKT
jgi:hypothetical protein